MARIPNPYTLDKTLENLRLYLSEIQGCGKLGGDALELLEKAVCKASTDKEYAQKMEDALLHGSTIECRDLFSVFGDYLAPPRTEFPFYPHLDSVNMLDTALYHIKQGLDWELQDVEY